MRQAPVDEAPDADEAASSPPGDGEVPTTYELGMGKRGLVLVAAAFTLILGVPAALFALEGRPELAVLLVGLFALMVVATGYAFREAVDAQRELDEG